MHLFGPKTIKQGEGLDEDLKSIGNIFQVVYSDSGSR